MPSLPITLDALRRYAIARTLFAPTSLPAAIKRLGFVQADPIRAPARAQDLTLRHRVTNYRAGDLERRYAALGVEEDFFVNYGFLPHSTQALLHPRTPRTAWPSARVAQAEAVLAFVQARGVVHPREVDGRFAHGRVSNWFGGTSNASTQLLDAMHYRGLLRVAGREGGIRTYAVAQHLPPVRSEAADELDADGAVDARMDALVDVIVGKYAPLPERSLRELIGLLRGGAPQWDGQRAAAFARATARLPSVQVDGYKWYWPLDESPTHKRHAAAQVDGVRLLTPFDPLVWDRRRFELLWGWAYRFEAYIPAPKRIRGYYALPLLRLGQMIGWGNLAVQHGVLHAELGFVAGQAPPEPAFRAALAEELARMECFLNLAEKV